MEDRSVGSTLQRSRYKTADLSDVLEGTDDYLKPAFRRECERHLPSPDSIEPAEAADAYRFLKSSVDPNRL